MLGDEQSIDGVSCIVGQAEPIGEEEVGKENWYIVHEEIELIDEVQESLLIADDRGRHNHIETFAHSPVCFPAASSHWCQMQERVKGAEHTLSYRVTIFEKHSKTNVILSSSEI